MLPGIDLLNEYLDDLNSGEGKTFSELLIGKSSLTFIKLGVILRGFI